MKLEEFTERAGQPANLITAYHEAGHAVMGYLLDVPFEYITIEENDEFLGHVRFQPDGKGNAAWQCFKIFHPEGSRPYGFGKRYDVLISSEVGTYVEVMMLIAAAGPVSEFIFRKESMDELLEEWWGGSDQEDFAQLAESVTGSEAEYLNYCQYMMEKTWNIMSLPAHEIVVGTLATKLLNEKTIGYSDACGIIKSSFDQLRDAVLADNNAVARIWGGVR